MLERPPVMVTRAAAATSHPLASEAALCILREGGSAADAAVAAGAVLTVVEPWASHIGGDAFAIAWDAAAAAGAATAAATAPARAIQGSGIAPRGIDPAAIAAAGAIPIRGPLPVTVPGMVHAWFHLLSTRGRLPVERVFARAIELASDGFPVGARWERAFRLHRDVVSADPGLAGLAAREGTWIRQPDLAATLRGLAGQGAAFLYDGPLGARIVDELRTRGGILGREDLAAHATEEIDPLAIEISGCTVLEQPPVSQGAMALSMLLALEETDRRGLRIDGDAPRASAREIHLQVEAYRAACGDRDRLLCDPRFAPAGFHAQVADWISRERASESVGQIDPLRAAAAPAAAAADTPDTTYLCVADPDGNVVSWIQSIFHPFGAGFVVPGAGIILNNRMTGFSTDPASPNRLEPGKRPIHTLNTWMVLRGGRPWLVGGTPGGEKQVQTNVQILRSRLVRGMSLAEAVRAPRWAIDEQDRVALEGRVAREARRRLERRGHRTVRIGPWEGSGFVQAMERLDGGGWLACTDPRGEGLALGF